MKTVLTCLSWVVCSTRLGSDGTFWDTVIEEVDQLSFVITGRLRSDLRLSGAACKPLQKQITFRAVPTPGSTFELILLSHTACAFIKWRISAWDTHTHDWLSLFSTSNVFHRIIRWSFHIVLGLDLAVITGGARPVSRPVLTGYVGSLGSVTRRQLGSCLPHLDTSGKARLSKYMGQYGELRKNKNKRDIVQFVARGMTSLWST